MCDWVHEFYYELIFSRIVCRTKASGGEKVGHVSVKVSGGDVGLSRQTFSYQVYFAQIILILC